MTGAVTNGSEGNVKQSITVPRPIARAFALFTAEMGSWWPAANTFANAAFVTVVVEPRPGGRWFERTTDGTETAWGRVLVWDPPHRVVLTWQITPEGQPEPDPAKASEVEVRFVATGPDTTRVELTHSAFERHGEEGGAIWRTAMASEGGWPLFLGRYAADD